ncbi:berberine bridge enzyme-like D-2 [Cannabis sativa]|uniref:berberine bridge enzyme-like D-2 n=1 Tax=Cannabis sativa TaxID=3483 RepID=UPI0029C9C7F3|nr:berberine bridge enzyme-like D-2 [Cannabis sativa]
MMNSLVYFLIIIVLLIVPSLEEDQFQYQITSCLTQHNINNFTTLHSNESKYYYKLLNFSMQNLRFADPNFPKPIAIILPQNVDQIKSVVLCARNASCKIIIRSGGHSYEGTSSTIDTASTANTPTPFVIMDLMNLNRVTVDLEDKSAWVEGGATLGETYYAIANATNYYGFSAGSCPTVGIGGHISGGGFGLLSRKYGVAADNVLDALLVDANGKLLDRESMGEDVFWAIRGGGGGVWGVVYAWKINLLKVPPIVTTFIVSRQGTKTQIANLIAKWQLVAPNLGDDFYLSCFVGAGLPETTTHVGISVTFKGFYLGPKNQTQFFIHQVFPELGIVEQDCFEMSWIQSIVFFSDLSPGSSVHNLQDRYLQNKAYFKAKSDYVHTPISHDGIWVALNHLEKEPKGYVILDPYGGNMDRISTESIAFPHRKGNLYTIQYMVEWSQQENNEKREDYIKWLRAFYSAMAPYVSWGPRAAYVNYIDFDLGVMVTKDHDDDDDDQLFDPVEIARAWGEKYFLNNFDRLVRAKTLIDPHNVFSNQQSIPPNNSNLVSLRRSE